MSYKHAGVQRYMPCQCVMHGDDYKSVCTKYIATVLLASTTAIKAISVVSLYYHKI